MTLLQRLYRMRRMFTKQRAILLEDYNFFTQPPTKTTNPDESTLRNTTARKSVELSSLRGPKRS